MNDQKVCPQCSNFFSSPQRFKSHLNRITPCDTINSKKIKIKLKSNNTHNENINVYIRKENCSQRPKKFFCQDCGNGFTRKGGLEKHQNGRCKANIIDMENLVETSLNNAPNEFLPMNSSKELRKLEEKFEKKFADLISMMESNSPKIVNNNLQIVCVGNADNYLDMLTLKWGNFDKALEYIASCALSNLVGDCKLIEKIYGSQNSDDLPSMCFVDKSQTKIEYFNENKEKVVDNRESFAKKLANNLQNSYLKGINHLINETLQSNGCPNKLLEAYDIQLWNQHIYNLSDVQYHKKIVTNLNISCK